MFSSQTRLPSGPALFLTDSLAIAWVVLWVLLGIAAADAIKDLAGLTDSFSTVGEAVTDAGDAVGGIELPLVGDQLAQAADQLRDAGRDVIASGEAGRASIERTANLLGLAIALVPCMPLLLSYLPPRMAYAGEARALRRTLAAGAGDPLLERFLAERAAGTLPYRKLRRVSAEPWRDLDEGRYERLAAAELRRLGVRSARLRGKRRI